MAITFITIFMRLSTILQYVRYTYHKVKSNPIYRFPHSHTAFCVLYSKLALYLPFSGNSLFGLSSVYRCTPSDGR